jgi:hypothetical protein
VAVWWEGLDAPAQEYNLYAVFSSKREYESYDWDSATFGLFDTDECAWEVTQCLVEWLDMPGWAQEWVETRGIPNGVIPSEREKKKVPLWVRTAFLEVVKHQHTNLMTDREPDADGDELYWEIDNQVLRDFAKSIGVEIPE